jgi:diguanylate cyclase (GGDEF)-like protein/PAS domain S-box-containing protein
MTEPGSIFREQYSNTTAGGDTEDEMGRRIMNEPGRSWLHRLLSPRPTVDGEALSATEKPWAVVIYTQNEAFGRELQHAVDETGRTAVVTDSPRKARKAVRSHDADSAIVDWRDDADRARRTLEAIRELGGPFRVSVIAVVSDDDEAQISTVIDGGADDYLAESVATAGVDARLRLLEERKRSANDLFESHRDLKAEYDRFLIASGGQEDGVWDWNVAEGTVGYSPQWKRMLGYADGDIGDTPDDWYSLVHAEDRERLWSMIDASLAGSITPLEHRYRIRHKDGSYRWMLTRGEVIRDDEGNVHRVVGRQTDITDEEGSGEEIRTASLHDPLTRLPNRTVLMDRLRHAFARAQRDPSRPFALLFFDLDRFKNVNDSLGHLTGDKLLRAIAERVQRACRPSDTVARFGGDEFVIIVENIHDVRGATSAAERIQEEFRVPFDLEGVEVFASISIGIAIWNTAYERSEDLLRDADTAMYRAKTMGRNSFAVFDEEMHARVVATLKLETDLRRAIARSEFATHYQPIISINDGRITGFEVLVRWNHPERGLLAPGEFIQVAEEMGAIIQIDRWVAEEACRQLRTWQNTYRHNPPLTVSVNISGTQFMQPDLVTQIDHILRKTGLYGRSLTVEVTESVLMENAQYASEMLDQLRALDINISIDDFGTGYSSLAYLRRFQIDTLKIDYSFVSRMLADEESEQIVRTITTLAGNLGKQTVAEGVETRSQFDLLEELHVDRVQGFFVSPPLTSESAEKLLASTVSADNHLKKILHDRLHSSKEQS